MTAILSACMIVRDEIDCLEACLDSIAPWVDEIAILDTGSVDGTWELVQVRAHVHAQVVWTDHFADARNRALDLPTGDWVLVIDADERLVSGGEALRGAISDPDLLAAEIRLKNALGDGEHGEFWAVRLFRRRPDLRYTGRIHEQVAGAVREVMAAEPEWRTARVPVVLEHDGYIPERFQEKGKAERNVRLLEIAVAELPKDAGLHQRVYLEYKLSKALGAGPQGVMWLLRAARHLMDAPSGDLASVPLAAEILVSASQAWCRSGEGSAALDAAQRAQARAPRHPMVSLVRAQALLLLGEVDEASSAIDAGVMGADGGFYFDPDGHAAAVAIVRAEVAHRKGDHDLAVSGLTQALAERPDTPGLAVARVHSLVRAGDAARALREAVAHLKAHPGDRGGLLACAAAADALGLTERAQRWRAMALG